MSEATHRSIKDSSYLKGRIGWQGLRASEFLEEGPFLVTGTDFRSGKIDWNNCYHVSEARFLEAPYIHLKDADILITKDGTIGKVAYITDCPDKAVLNSGIFLLRCRDGSYRHDFAFQILNSELFRDFLRKNLNGSTINHLYQRVFEKFLMPTPKLGVQGKIATVLKSIDQAIEKTEALIEKYEQIKAGMMHDLFTRGLTPDGKLRPPRDQAPELYKGTPIGWIPKEWECEAIETIKNSLVDGPFGSNLKSEHYVVDPGVRVVRLQNIEAGLYNDRDRAFVSDRHALALHRNQVVGGDILIAGLGEERYPVARACLYPEQLPAAINKADCFRLRCDEGKMINAFMMHFLNTAAARKQVRRYEQGVTRPRINLGNMNRILTPKPTIGEQQQVVNKLSSLVKSIEFETAKCEKLYQQKSGLMHDLLTGKVPVKLDKPEVAHV